MTLYNSYLYTKQISILRKNSRMTPHRRTIYAWVPDSCYTGVLTINEYRISVKNQSINNEYAGVHLH